MDKDMKKQITKIYYDLYRSLKVPAYIAYKKAIEKYALYIRTLNIPIVGSLLFPVQISLDLTLELKKAING